VLPYVEVLANMDDVLAAVNQSSTLGDSPDETLERVMVRAIAVQQGHIVDPVLQREMATE